MRRRAASCGVVRRRAASCGVVRRRGRRRTSLSGALSAGVSRALVACGVVPRRAAARSASCVVQRATARQERTRVRLHVSTPEERRGRNPIRRIGWGRRARGLPRGDVDGAPPSRQSAPGLAPPPRTQPGLTHPVTVAPPRHRVHSRESCGPRSRQTLRERAQSKKFWFSFGNFCHYFLFQKKSAEKKIMFFRPT